MLDSDVWGFYSGVGEPFGSVEVGVLVQLASAIAAARAVVAVEILGDCLDDRD